jgi:predicted PurR-regulated permease PerM
MPAGHACPVLSAVILAMACVYSGAVEQTGELPEPQPAASAATGPAAPPSAPPAAPPGDAGAAATDAEPPKGIAGRLRGLRARRQIRADRHFSERFSAELGRRREQVRHERREPAPAMDIHAGPSDMRPASVPYGVDLAAAWGWRFLVIMAAGYVVLWLVGYFLVIVLPLVVALLIAALVMPVVDLLDKALPRGPATLLVVLAVLATIALALTFATQQVVDGSTDLANKVVDGLDTIRDWLRTGPLNASEQQIDDGIDQLQAWVTAGSDQLIQRATQVGATVGHVVAGFFLVLFASFFFMYDGGRIWAWLVRLFPRSARARADSSGRVAWLSLTQFVRATVLVALVDAIGIMVVAAILGVPFVLAIGVLVFLSSFVPLVGATVSGAVAVLVALVDQGVFVALLMLGGVIAVQQLEAHVLQPFLLGRMVAVHPLAVIVAIGAGVIVAGIAGALVAVPLAACVNAIVLHLASGTEQEPERGPLADDPGPPPALQ